MNRTPPALLRCIFFAGCVLVPSGAAAQGAPPSPPPASDDAGAAAVALAREGVSLYEAGKWADAEQKFAAAEAKLHSPVFVLYLARSQRNAGRWLEARATLRKLAAESPSADAPPSWRQALVDARAELAALEPTIPSIVVAETAVSSGSTLVVDGKPAAAGAVIELDPGVHEVAVQGAGRRDVTAVELRGGERGKRIDVIRRGASPPPDNLLPPSRSAPPREAPVRDTNGSWVPGGIVLGLGVAGLGVGAVTGVMALGKSDDVQEQCPEGTCQASVDRAVVEDDRAAAGTLADVSTIAFIAGGVVATAGIVLIIARPFGGEEDVAVTASPGAVAIGGAF